jgi:hypothetical protein
MIDLQDLHRMPPRLQRLMLEAVSWRGGKQSDIARLQRVSVQFFKDNTGQGQRIDLEDDGTCTQNDVHVGVGKRRKNSTEKAADYWNESESTVRKRVDVLNAAEEDPEKWGRYLQQMDAAGSPHAAHKRLLAARQ